MRKTDYEETGWGYGRPGYGDYEQGFGGPEGPGPDPRTGNFGWGPGPQFGWGPGRGFRGGFGPGMWGRGFRFGPGFGPGPFRGGPGFGPGPFWGFGPGRWGQGWGGRHGWGRHHQHGWGGRHHHGGHHRHGEQEFDLNSTVSNMEQLKTQLEGYLNRVNQALEELRAEQARRKESTPSTPPTGQNDAPSGDVTSV